jgi:hypothetical protein
MLGFPYGAPQFRVFKGLSFPILAKLPIESQGLFRVFPKPPPYPDAPRCACGGCRACGVLVKEEIMQQEVDISGLDYPALTGLRERIDERVREMRESGGPARWRPEFFAL